MAAAPSMALSGARGDIGGEATVATAIDEDERSAMQPALVSSERRLVARPIVRRCRHDDCTALGWQRAGSAARRKLLVASRKDVAVARELVLCERHVVRAEQAAAAMLIVAICPTMARPLRAANALHFEKSTRRSSLATNASPYWETEGRMRELSAKSPGE